MSKIIDFLFQKRHRGQGIVEFALVLPLLLLVMFAVIEFGRLLFFYSVVHTASREAARYGSAAGNVGGYVAHYQDCNGIRASARRIGNLVGLTDSNISITYDQGPGTGLIGSCPIGGRGPSLELGYRINVDVLANYRPILPLVRIPSFVISSNSSRTILKNVSIQGTPMAETSGIPRVYFTEISNIVPEGNTTQPNAATIFLELSEVVEHDVFVQLIIGGSAEAGVDYQLSHTSPIEIEHGFTRVGINVTILGDSIDEYNETLIVSIAGVTNAVRDEPDVHSLTIIDDDEPPFVTFATAAHSVIENVGQTRSVIRLVDGAGLPITSGKEVQVPYTWSGTATELLDYDIVAGPAVFSPGQNQWEIPIDIVNDTLYELDEYIDIQLGTPTNAVLNTYNTPGFYNQHQVTIVSDETTPRVKFEIDEQVVPEQAGSFPIEVLLVNDLGEPAASSLDVFVDLDFTGTAVLGEDYVLDNSYDYYHQQGGYLLIPAGRSSSTLMVDLATDDELVEDNETVIVTMSSVVNAIIGQPSVHTALVTSSPTIYFKLAESQTSESDGTVAIDVMIMPMQTRDITVGYSLSGTASYPDDYVFATDGQVVIPAGQSSVKIEVTLIDDLLSEQTETAIITLTAPTGVFISLPDVHTLTIADNDPLPVVTFTTASQTVEEDIGRVLVGVRLNAAAGRVVTVSVGVAGTATPELDYLLALTNPIVFQPGETSAVIQLDIVDDLLQEVNETVIFSLSLPVNAIVGTPGTHSVIIKASDLPTCNIYTANELQFNSIEKRISWELSNFGTSDLILKSATIAWPSESPDAPHFSYILFGIPTSYTQIWGGDIGISPATVSTFNGFDVERTLGAGDTRTVWVGFSPSLTTGSYSISLVFYNPDLESDCSTVTQSGSLQ